jgi:N-methylhydantoinase A/oxoprolinase/acetone carboxylase beta subunit
MVHAALDAALSADAPPEGAGRFAVPLWAAKPEGLDAREALVAGRLSGGPLPLAEAVRARTEGPALDRLVRRGLAMIAGVTPSDAAHQAGLVDVWDGDAAAKALTLFARKRNGRGERIAEGPGAMVGLIIAQLQAQTALCLLEAAFAEDGDWADPGVLARHPLVQAGLNGHQGVIRAHLSLGVPVIGLGASAPAYYGAVGDRLGTRMVLPAHAGVANAIGAVVGQVAMTEKGTVTSTGPGLYLAHLAAGPQRFSDRDAALAAQEAALTDLAMARARAAGVGDIRLTATRSLREVTVEGAPMFIEAEVRVTAQGRPRIAV